VADENLDNPGHALIESLPDPFGDDAERAVRLAVALAEMARLTAVRDDEHT
jgi:hypothetical protein